MHTEAMTIKEEGKDLGNQKQLLLIKDKKLQEVKVNRRQERLIKIKHTNLKDITFQVSHTDT